VSRRQRLIVFAATVVPAILASGSALAFPDEAPPAEARIQTLRALPENAVRVSGFRLNTGHGVVALEEGVLVPAGVSGHRPVEFAFVGTGRVVMDPEDPVERSQLEIFTGSPVLDETISRAVFVVTLDAASDALIGMSPAGSAPGIDEALEVYAAWRSSPERRLLDVDARLLRDLVGDSLGRGYFSGYFEGEELGRFLWAVDPLADEQLTLGQFLQPELTSRERRKAARHLEREQRRGKLIGLEVDDQGIWNTWVSASIRTEEGDPAPGTTGVESSRYTIEATLRGKQLALKATATIEMQVLVSGLRAVTLDLPSDLVVSGVSNAAGEELGYVQSYDELTVILNSRPRAGDELSLTVDYSGRPIDRLASGAFVNRRPTRWYPRAGAVDRATYDVTVRWPKKLDLLGSGTVTDEGVDGNVRWQRRVLDVATLGFSFEIGDYDIAVGTMGDTSITVAIDRLAQGVSDDLADDILQSVRGPLAYFESIFGPYPLDELVVVSSPKSYSQGLLGFVTLSTVGIVDWDVWGTLLGFEDRRLLVAHELAHQWWGNQVGWRSYRDLWISEAMANYAALLYERNRLRSMGGATVGLGPTSGWREALETRTADGRPVESLGPVVMGSRLNSSLSGDAYQTIVYQKGAVVLDMLARLYGEDTFIQMLREIVKVASDRVVSTDDFLLMLERLGGVSLEWFSSQYIYGTGMPEILYDYSIEAAADGSWVIQGQATQQSTFRLSYRVVEGADGSLDVLRSASARLDVTDSVLVVPFQVGLLAASADGSDLDADPNRRMLTGRIVLQGTPSPFRLELAERPEVFWLDRFQEVFGRFLSESHWPRRASYLRGRDLALAGRSESAERELLGAFDAPAVTGDDGWLGSETDVELETRRVDTAIHLELARLYLDRGDSQRASDQLELARQRMRRADSWYFDRSLLPLEGRLELIAGRSDEAVKVLRKGLGGRRSAESAEAWALLAVAAHLEDRSKDYSQACQRALDRGVDLGPLTCQP
jgi:hypothetical protein